MLDFVVPHRLTQMVPPLLLCVACAGNAQIRVTTRVVEVNVVVHDSKGRPVSNLSKSDFRLYDEGQEQDIRYFSKETNEPWPDESGAKLDGLVSNRFATVQVDGKTRVRALPNSVTAILLDGLNTRFADQAQAKEALIQFLKQLHSGDQVAIYTLTDRLQVLHDFTSDVATLLGALNRHRHQESRRAAASSVEPSNTGIDYIDAMIDRANAKIAGFNISTRGQITLGALRAIANRLAGLPGRKNLIWLASSFPIADAVNGINPSEAQQSTWRSFSEAGIALYPVDARGLIGMADWTPSLSPSSISHIVTGRNPADVKAQDEIAQSHSTMNLLAERTGGRACIGNDLAGCIRGALDDIRVTYTLSFSPSHERWDGRFREIRIKLRQSGLEARYRRGYYAMPDAPADEKTRDDLLADAAMSPLISTGLTMVARLVEKPSEATPRAAVSIVLDPHDVAFGRDDPGLSEATLDLRVLVFGDLPAPLKEKASTAHLALKPDEYNRFLKEGVMLNTSVETPPGSQRLRVVVRDGASGKLGSLDLPLQ